MSSALFSYLRRERGAQKATAEALGVDRITLYRWARRGVPAEKILEIEKATGIARHELRPDLFADPDPASVPGAA
jgi:DNA-binding transcriptional regulator YdaS (Cro superfamily)